MMDDTEDFLKQSTECQESVNYHAGDLCPICGQEYLDYNGLLELICDHCGFVLASAYT